jgi:hypothetical protein
MSERTIETKAPSETRRMVCFTSALVRGEHISHATLDGELTLCGRSGWFAEDAWTDIGPDCLICSKALVAERVQGVGREGASS